MLERIRGALGREAVSDLSTLDVPADIIARMQNPNVHARPSVGTNLIEQLIERMESVQMTVVRLQTSADIVNAVDWYRSSEGIDGDITVSPALSHLEWPSNVTAGKATGQENMSVTPCLCAIAETGSIALKSAGDTPATLGFLPDTHIVVLHESQVVSHLEDAWAQLRSLDVQPRALNLVTGPSRTGDIEQTIELGAHGPRRLHVLLISGN